MNPNNNEINIQIDPKIQIRLFGAFRGYLMAKENFIELPLSKPMSVAQVKELLIQHLDNLKPNENTKNLVLDSAIASDDQILQDSDFINLKSRLSILPPVCGG